MKKLSWLIIALIFFGFSNHMLAGKGKPFTGKIAYSISYEGKQVADVPEGMLPTSMAMYIGDGFTKSVLFTGMGKQIVISNIGKKTKTTLIDMMGQQFAIESNFEEIHKEMDREKDAEVKVTDETKEIAGYTCKKMILTFKNDKGETKSENFAWFTEELEVNPEMNFDQKYFKDVKGVMMEYEMDMENDMIMKFTATEVEKKKVPSKDFDIPEEYKKVTREELMNSLGG